MCQTPFFNSGRSHYGLFKNKRAFRNGTSQTYKSKIMHKNKRSEKELQEIIHDPTISFYGQLGDAIVNGAIGRLRKREDRIFLRALVSGALMATFVCIMIS